MSDITRRQLLAVGGVGAMGAIAGCTGGSSDDDRSGNTEEPAEPEGTILGDISVQNLSNDSHTVDVIVQFDDEIEHWSTHPFEDDDDNDIELERTWSSDPGSVRVTARLDGDRLRQSTPTEWNDPDCANLLIQVRRSGDLRITWDTTDGPCNGGDSSGASNSARNEGGSSDD